MMNIDKLVARYEEMAMSGQKVYFDVEEIEQLAHSYEKNDDFSESLKVVNYGLSMYPGNESLLIQQVKFMLFENHLEQIETLIPLLPQNDVLVRLILIEYHFVSDDVEKANSLIDKLMVSPEFNCSIAMNVVNILWGYTTTARIIEFLESAIKILKSQSRLMMELAVVFREDGQEEKAIVILNELIDLNPSLIRPWIELSETYVSIQNPTKALQTLNFALSIDNTHLDLIVQKMKVLSVMGRDAEAVELLEQLENTVEDKKLLYAFYAESLLKEDRTQEAIVWLEKIGQLDPESIANKHRLALSYMDLGNSPRAIELMEEVVAVETKNADFLVFLANLYLEIPEYEKAYDSFKRALILKGKDAEIFISLGDIGEKLDLMQEAVEHYESARRLRKYDIKICFRLLLAYYTTEQTDKALILSKEINELIEKSKNNDITISAYDREEIIAASQAVDSLRNILNDIIKKQELTIANENWK